MAKRTDTSVSQREFRIGLQKVRVTPKSGPAYVQFKAYLLVDGCPIPLEIRAETAEIEGKRVAWLTAAGTSMKDLVPDPV